LTEFRCFSSSLTAAADPAPAASSLDQSYRSTPLHSTERKKNVSSVEYNHDLLEGSR